MTDPTIMIRRALYRVQATATPIPAGTPRPGEQVLDAGANDVIDHLLPLLRAQGLHWLCTGARANAVGINDGVRTVLVHHQLEHMESGQIEKYTHEIHYDGKLAGIGTTKAAAAQALELLVGVARQRTVPAGPPAPDDFDEPRATEVRAFPAEAVVELAEAQITEGQRAQAIASLRQALLDAGDNRTNEQLRAAARVPLRGAMAPADQETYRLFLAAEVRSLEVGA